MKDAISKLIQKTGKGFDQESRSLVRNSSWVFISNGIGTFYAFLKTILIARFLGADLLGSYTLAIAFVLTTQELLRLNVSMGLIRFGARYSAEGRRDKLVAVIKFSLLLSSLSAIVSVLVLSILVFLSYNSFIHTPGIGFYVIAFAIANGTSFIDAISKATLKLHFKFRMNSIIQIIMDTLEITAIALTLFIYGKNLEAFFTASIIAKLANSFICNLGAYRELLPELRENLNAKISLIREEFREFIKYITGNSLSSSLKVLMNQGDVLLLGAFSPASEVGLYSIAKKLAYSVLTLTDPLAISVFPQFSHLIAKKDFSKVRIMVTKITTVLVFPAISALTIAYFFREPLLALLYGQEYSSAGNAFIILLAGAIQGSVFFWALPLIQSLGLIRKRFVVYLIATAIGAATGIALIPVYGATGVAIGLLIANLYITFHFVKSAWRKLVSIPDPEEKKPDAEIPGLEPEPQPPASVK